MSISIDSAYQNMLNTYQTKADKSSSDAKAAALEQKLSGDLSNASEQELMDVCKSFESYLVEQVLKQAKETLAPSEEDENEYISMFSDNLYEAYAEQITENGEIGLAQQLFEAMKKDYNL